jgi:hypothetical protein
MILVGNLAGLGQFCFALALSVSIALPVAGAGTNLPPAAASAKAAKPDPKPRREIEIPLRPSESSSLLPPDDSLHLGGSGVDFQPDFRAPNNPAPAPAAPPATLFRPSRDQLRELEAKKNWILVRPEDGSTDDAIKQAFKVKDFGVSGQNSKDKADEPVTTMQRYLDFTKPASQRSTTDRNIGAQDSDDPDSSRKTESTEKPKSVADIYTEANTKWDAFFKNGAVGPAPSLNFDPAGDLKPDSRIEKDELRRQSSLNSQLNDLFLSKDSFGPPSKSGFGTLPGLSPLFGDLSGLDPLGRSDQPAVAVISSARFAPSFSGFTPFQSQAPGGALRSPGLPGLDTTSGGALFSTPAPVAEPSRQRYQSSVLPVPVRPGLILAQ